MYKAKLWDEDKWNIHSSGYNSSKYSAPSADHKDDKKYHEQKYGSEKNSTSDYIRKEDQKDSDDKEKRDSIFDEAAEEKNEKQEIKDDDIQFKAAKLVFSEKKSGAKNIEAKKDSKTIEDAIKKAIEDEKKVIIMDN